MGGRFGCQYVRSQEQIIGSAGSVAFELFGPSQAVPLATRTDLIGRAYKQEVFRFDAAVCGACPLRSQCTSAKSGAGRTVRLHPQEALLQEARSLQ